jgi:peptidyl-prolyl cis-trans isomerase B (cyclophilin B)
MNTFNNFYYLFSPQVADLEREHPLFKETVKIGITPLLFSLSLLNNVDMDSEIEVVGYGVSIILLNVGMYFVVPTLFAVKLSKK